MAALIMASVFAAFIPTPNNTIKLFGVALASAVLVDAFLIRLIFVPSFMSMLGKANWWLPAWLADRLPHFEVEGGADEIADDRARGRATPTRSGSPSPPALADPRRPSGPDAAGMLRPGPLVVNLTFVGPPARPRRTTAHLIRPLMAA